VLSKRVPDVESFGYDTANASRIWEKYHCYPIHFKHKSNLT